MQVIGVCRFSYPAVGGFQVTHRSAAEREAYLYQPERMEERLRLFETVALPGLKAQTDPDFTLIIVTGTSLPPQFRTRLDALVAGIPQVRIKAEEPAPMREVMKLTYLEARSNPEEPCLQFRHDDDDAVAIDFVERLKQAAWDCCGMLEKVRYAGIDFSRGYTARFGPEGICASETYRPWLGVAMGMYAGPGESFSIMNVAHHKMTQHMPGITFSDSPMWVRSHNGFNDSRSKNPSGDPNLQPASGKLEGRFARRFGIDADLIRRRFSDT
jgi:hypothetical protein